jgi:DNA-binding NarL/FixJ family response regulator
MKSATSTSSTSVARPAPRANGERRSSSEKKTGKRIVIVDDHPLFRKGLEDLINHSDESFVVCGEAGEAAQALGVLRDLKPDLAIVDLSLPGANGIELLKNIRAEFQKLPVLILSMHDESLYALRALRAGAQGYVMKQEALENVITAIRQVLAGRPYLSPEMSAKLINNFASGSTEPSVTDKLSDRELEILELIGKGRDVREISRALHISTKTVETHRAHIKEKLNLTNARQVARFAVQWLAGEAGR